MVVHPSVRDYRKDPLRVVLVTGFAESHLQQDTLPELARRGVEIVTRVAPTHVSKLDLKDLRERKGVELVLLMHEVCGHAESGLLLQAARAADVPVQTLSRKKASWSFLPAPLQPHEPDPADAMEVSASSSDLALEMPPSTRILRSVAGAPTIRDDEDDLDPELRLVRNIVVDSTLRERIYEYVRENGLTRKEVRLRDAVRYYLFVYSDYEELGITRERRDEMVLESVRAGRDDGTFPRLFRVKSQDLPRLVRSYIADEESKRTQEVEPMIESIPSSSLAQDPSVATEAAESVVASASELQHLRARVAQLEKLQTAFDAFQTLVRQGYLTATEAAERLFVLRRES